MARERTGGSLFTERLDVIEDAIEEGALRLALASLKTVTQEAIWQSDELALDRAATLAMEGAARARAGSWLSVEFRLVADQAGEWQLAADREESTPPEGRERQPLAGIATPASESRTAQPLDRAHTPRREKTRRFAVALVFHATAGVLWFLSWGFVWAVRGLCFGGEAQADRPMEILGIVAACGWLAVALLLINRPLRERLGSASVLVISILWVVAVSGALALVIGFTEGPECA